MTTRNFRRGDKVERIRFKRPDRSSNTGYIKTLYSGRELGGPCATVFWNDGSEQLVSNKDIRRVVR